MTGAIRALLLFLLLDLAIAGGFWYAYRVTIEKKESLAELREQVADEDDRARQSSVLNRTLKEVNTRHSSLMDFLTIATEENEVRLVESIEGLSAATGLEVVTAGYGYDPKKGKLAIDLRTEGTWSQTYHFLRLIESYPGRLVLVRAGLQGEEGKPSENGGTWRGTPLSLELYSITEVHQHGTTQ